MAKKAATKSKGKRLQSAAEKAQVKLDRERLKAIKDLGISAEDVSRLCKKVAKKAPAKKAAKKKAAKKKTSKRRSKKK